MNATTKAGDIIGFDADLARSIAENMGVKPTFVSLPFADLLPALEKGKVDMVISAVTMLPERNLKVAFAGPYFISGKGILTKTKNVENFQDAEGLNRPEFKVAALKDSTSLSFVGKYAPKAQSVATVSYDAAIALLLDDKVDALVADFPFCAYAAFRYGDRGLTAGRSRLSFEPLGIAMSEDALLINWTQNYLMTMEGSGRLGRIREFWFKNSEWIKQLKE
jgi:polar amino acid transport system substrate-binding protein